MSRVHSVVMMGLVLAGCAASAYGQSCAFTEPASGNCAFPREIPGSVGHHVVLMDTQGATDTGTMCVAPVPVGNKVYFRVTPEVTGPITVSTCHPMTMFDTVVEVATGGELCETGTIEACNDDTDDDDCPANCYGRASRVTLYAYAGQPYTIRVGSYNSNPDECYLCLGLVVTIGTPCGDVPDNFICELAEQLPGHPGVHEFEIDARGAPDNEEHWCNANSGHGVWFHFTATTDATATFSTCHSSTTYDTVVRAVSGCSGTVMEHDCNDDTLGLGCWISCPEMTGERTTQISFKVWAGVDYFVEVGSYANNWAGCELCLGGYLTIAECTQNSDCDDGNPCTVDTCDQGVCTTDPLPIGTPCTDDGNDCTDDVCYHGGCAHFDRENGWPCGSGSDTDCDDPDTCLNGTCESNYEPSGTSCTDDENDCTEDYCHRGACLHDAREDGSECGSGADTDCDDPDTCLEGSCRPNYVPGGVACTDDGNQCTHDLCDHGGFCTHPNRSNGSSCGSGVNTDCDDPDTCQNGTCYSNFEPFGTLCTDDGSDCTNDQCDGSGQCTHPALSFGTPCGDPSDTVCTDPDSCDGAGTCLTRHTAAGTPCPDGLYCDGEETCNGAGLCASGSPPCVPPEICYEATDTCDTDCNGNGTPDGEEQGLTGAEVVRQLAPVADTYVDSSASDSNFGGDTHAPASFLEFGVQVEGGDPIEAESWIAFDLEDIPPSATIVGAFVRLHVHPGGFGPPMEVSVHPALSPWAEAELTWGSRPSTGAAAADGMIGPDTTEVLFDVTALAQGWVSDTIPNHGMALQPAHGGVNWIRFAGSRESASPPELAVTYRMPVCSMAFSGGVELTGFGPPEENPVPEIRVDLYGTDAPRGLGSLIATGTTDSQGRYVLHHSLVGDYPYARYTLVVNAVGYEVTQAVSTSGGASTPEGNIEFQGASPDHYPGNIFRIEPTFFPPIEDRTFGGTVVTAGPGAPAARVEVVLYGADDPAQPDRILAGASTAEDGTFQVSIQADPKDVFPHYVLQVADFEAEVIGAESGDGNPTDDHRIVFAAPAPGTYVDNTFQIQPLGASATARGQAVLRPVVVVILTYQCTCAGCPNTCDASGCRNITNANVLTAFGQTMFDANGDSVHNFFLEMSHDQFGLSQAGLFQVVPNDLAATPNVNESTMCRAFATTEQHRAWVSEHVLGNQLNFNFANFDADSSGTVEEDELVVLITTTDPNSGNARMRVSDPRTVQVGGVGVRVHYVMVQPGTDFYTIAHEIAHTLPYSLRSGMPGDLYGGEGNAGSFSLMDNHCHGRVNPRDPNIPWTAAQHMNNRRFPHLDPWNKIQLGWITPTVVTSDAWTTIDAIADPWGKVYKLQVASHGTSEYFLIENRWATGSDYDTDLIDSGLAIWHINESYLPDQRRVVALERAGGGTNSGGASDFCNDDGDTTALWSGEEEFHPYSSPSSDWNNGSNSGLAAVCISAPGPSVGAYLSVNWTQNLLVEDVGEPNDTKAEAEVITVPGVYNYSLHAFCDRDFISFTTTDVVNLTITVDAFTDPFYETPASPPTMTLRGDDDALVDTQNGSITQTSLPAGTYYLEIYKNALIYYRVAFGAIASTIPPDEYDDQTPPGEPRNDTPANAAIIPDVVYASTLFFGLEIEDLNHDIAADIDFFDIQLDSATSQSGLEECCTAPGPDTTQGALWIQVWPVSDRPFDITVYKPNGQPLPTVSGFSYHLECPHKQFPDGRVRFSVRDTAGRNFYEVTLRYNRCDTRFYPDWFLEYEPPLFHVPIPDLLGPMRWRFPNDPRIIEGYLGGTVFPPFPPEFMIFDWLHQQDYLLDVHLPAYCAGAGCLDISLLNEAGELVGAADWIGGAARAAGVPPPPTKRIDVPDLPGGMYFLRLQNGAFGTDFVMNSIVYGDLDTDQDADLRDFAAFQRCFGRSLDPPQDPACVAGDLSDDGVINLADHTLLSSFLTGPR